MPAKHEGTLVINGANIRYRRNPSVRAICFCSETSFGHSVLNNRSSCLHVGFGFAGSDLAFPPIGLVSLNFLAVITLLDGFYSEQSQRFRLSQSRI